MTYDTKYFRLNSWSIEGFHFYPAVAIFWNDATYCDNDFRRFRFSLNLWFGAWGFSIDFCRFSEWDIHAAETRRKLDDLRYQLQLELEIRPYQIDKRQN